MHVSLYITDVFTCAKKPFDQLVRAMQHVYAAQNFYLLFLCDFATYDADIMCDLSAAWGTLIRCSRTQQTKPQDGEISLTTELYMYQITE